MPERADAIVVDLMRFPRHILAKRQHPDLVTLYAYFQPLLAAFCKSMIVFSEYRHELHSKVRRS